MEGNFRISPQAARTTAPLTRAQIARILGGRKYLMDVYGVWQEDSTKNSFDVLMQLLTMKKSVVSADFISRNTAE